METQIPKDPIYEQLMNDKCNMPLKRREWLVIYNILVSREYKLGDAMIVMGIVNQIEPLIVVATNISKENSKKQVEEAKLTITKKQN